MDFSEGVFWAGSCWFSATSSKKHESTGKPHYNLTLCAKTSAGAETKTRPVTGPMSGQIPATTQWGRPCAPVQHAATTRGTAPPNTTVQPRLDQLRLVALPPVEARRCRSRRRATSRAHSANRQAPCYKPTTKGKRSNRNPARPGRKGGTERRGGSRKVPVA